MLLRIMKSITEMKYQETLLSTSALTLASSANLFWSSTSSAVVLSSPPVFFFFFCLGAMKPCRNFLITLSCRVITHSPKSCSFSKFCTWKHKWGVRKVQSGGDIHVARLGRTLTKILVFGMVMVPPSLHALKVSHPLLKLRSVLHVSQASFLQTRGYLDNVSAQEFKQFLVSIADLQAWVTFFRQMDGMQDFLVTTYIKKNKKTSEFIHFYWDWKQVVKMLFTGGRRCVRVCVYILTWPAVWVWVRSLLLPESEDSLLVHQGLLVYHTQTWENNLRTSICVAAQCWYPDICHAMS